MILDRYHSRRHHTLKQLNKIYVQIPSSVSMAKAMNSAAKYSQRWVKIQEPDQGFDCVSLKILKPKQTTNLINKLFFSDFRV